jgi:hypothetical protein
MTQRTQREITPEPLEEQQRETPNAGNSQYAGMLIDFVGVE